MQASDHAITTGDQAITDGISKREQRAYLKALGRAEELGYCCVADVLHWLIVERSQGCRTTAYKLDVGESTVRGWVKKLEITPPKKTPVKYWQTSLMV